MSILEISFIDLFEDQRLDQNLHMLSPKHELLLLKYHVIGLCKPFRRLWIHIRPSTSLPLYIGNDALGTLHVLNSLLCHFIEALIEHEELAELMHFWLLASQQKSVDATYILYRDASLIEEAL